jgi:hypothetical protein
MSGPGNAWRGIIGGLEGREHLFDRMPPPGGFTASAPAAVMSSAGHAVEVVYGRKGKKKIKKVSKPEEEERQMTLEEAMEAPQKMFKYLKQYNKRKDRRYEESELNSFVDEDDIVA